MILGHRIHKRPLIVVFVLLCLFYWHGSPFWGLPGLGGKADDPMESIFVVEAPQYALRKGLPNVHNLAEKGESVSGADVVTRLKERLVSVFRSDGMSGQSIKTGPGKACILSEQLRMRYAPLQRGTNLRKRMVGNVESDLNGGIFLAMTLYNNQDILINLLDQIVRLVVYLGREYVHISIYENGSTDHTKALLAHFAAALDALGVDHTVTGDESSDDIVEKPWRIARLAQYRNDALSPMLDPLVPLPKGSHVAKIAPGKAVTELHARKWSLFLSLNDVVGCVQDLLEVIYQKEAQSADMTCAWDWHSLVSPEFDPPGILLLYDNWVTRSITGQFPYHVDIASGIWTLPSEPFSEMGDEYTKAQVKAGRPTRVYSCYNGFSAISATFFNPPKEGGFGIEWRAARSWDSLLAKRVSDLQLSGHVRTIDESVKYAPITNESYWTSEESELEQLRIGPERPGECPASECTLLCKDLHRASVRVKGHAARIAVVPRAALAYDESDYSRLVAQRLTLQDWSREKIDWDAEEKKKWLGHGLYGLPSRVKCFPWGVESAVGFWKYGVWAPSI